MKRIQCMQCDYYNNDRDLRCTRYDIPVAEDNVCVDYDGDDKDEITIKI